MPKLTKNAIHKEKSAQEGLVILLTNAFLKNRYFNDKEHLLEELKECLKDVDPLFIAKTAVYIRIKYNIRELSFFIAVELLNYVESEKWLKDFFCSIVKIPEDMLDIISILMETRAKIPNSMKKGFARAFEKFDNYQLLKQKNKNFKMQDLISLVHPKPSKLNQKSIDIILNNAVELKNIQDLDNTEIIKRIGDLEFY